MKYQLKAGVLCQLTDKETLTPIASIKNKLCGAEKKIQVERFPIRSHGRLQPLYISSATFG